MTTGEAIAIIKLNPLDRLPTAELIAVGNALDLEAKSHEEVLPYVTYGAVADNVDMELSRREAEVAEDLEDRDFYNGDLSNLYEELELALLDEEEEYNQIYRGV